MSSHAESAAAVDIRPPVSLPYHERKYCANC